MAAANGDVEMLDALLDGLRFIARLVMFHDEQFNGLNHDLWLDEMKVNAISPISLTHRLKNNLVNGKDKKVVFISSQMGSIDDNYSGNYYFYRSSKTNWVIIFFNIKKKFFLTYFLKRSYNFV